MKTFTLPGNLFKSLCFTLLLTALSLTGFAQMKIGNRPTQIHKSSILELESDRQALLLPRLSTFNDINTIIGTETESEIVGMIVYYTGNTEEQGAGLYCFQDSSGTYKWIKIASASNAASNWSLKGNDITSGDFLGTTNAEDLVIKTGNTTRMTIAGDGTSLKVDNGLIGNGGTADLDVLLIKDNSDGTATILQRKLPADIFSKLITGITGDAGGSTKLDAGDLTFQANGDQANDYFEVLTDGTTKTATIKAPVLGVGNSSNVAFGFLTKTDWDKLQSLTDANKYSVADYIAAAASEVKRGASLDYDETTQKLTLTLYAADAGHAGIVTEIAQTFGGNKTFAGAKTTVSNDLAVGGNATVVGTLGVTDATTLDGATTINNTLDVTGTTKLENTLSLLNVATPATAPTDYDVLFLDPSGVVQKTSISADATKDIKLGNTPDNDPFTTVPGTTGLNIDNTGTELVINIPNADATVRGVISAADQTFGGNKTFNGNTTVGDGTTAANLTVQKGETKLQGETTIGTTGESANLTVHGGIAAKTVTITSTTASLDANVRTFLVDASGGDVTVPLPTTVANGTIYTFRIVKNSPGMNKVTISGSFGDGNPGMIFYNVGSSRTIQKDGGKWYITGQ